MMRGKTIVEIPAGTMHSFEAANNKIVWALKVEGKIDRWPDIDEEYRLNVAG
jgi:hypothetical protein